MQLERKYMALLEDARQRGAADLGGMQLCFQILSLAAGIDRDCAALLSAQGLTEGRFVLLFLLDVAPDGLAPHVLAERAGVTRATITTLLDGLQRADLAERRADATDRRALTVYLTDKGKAVAQEMVAAHAQWIGGLFGHLSAQERSQLSNLLTKAAQGRAPAEQERAP